MADRPETTHEESPAATATACATCGADVDATAWHPVATHVDEDGDFHLHAFCSIECRTAWEPERARPGPDQ